LVVSYQEDGNYDGLRLLFFLLVSLTLLVFVFSFVAAHLRLGLIALERGDVLRAAEAFKNTAEAALASAQSAEPVMQQQAFSAAATAFCLLGRARESAGDANGAREAYRAAENVPAKGVPGVFGGFLAAGSDGKGGAGGGGVDPYPSIALANLAFKDVYSASDERAREPILRACFDSYKNALKRSPTNLYAANGLGMILAEQGKLDAAHDVFAKAREASPDALPPTMNLAHTQVALGNVGPALQLYSHASKKLLGNGSASASLLPALTPGGLAVEDGTTLEQVKLLSYEARAQMNDPATYASAVKALTKAVHLAPNDLRARFNLSFAMAEEALRVLKLDPTQRTAAEVEEAVEHMKASAKGFEWLLTTLDGLHAEVAAAEAKGDKDAITRLNARIASVGKDREVVRPLVAHVSGTIPAAMQHLADARRRAVQSAAEAERRAALAAQRQREKEELERAAREAEEIKKRAARDAAKKLQDLLSETQAKAAERAAEEKEKESNKENAGAAGSSDEVGAKRKKPLGGKGKKKARPAKRLKAGESDDENGGAGSASSSDSDSDSSSDSDSDSDSSSSSDSDSDSSSSSSSSSDSDSSSDSSSSDSDSDSSSSDDDEAGGEGGKKKNKKESGEQQPADALEAVFGKAEEAKKEEEGPDMEALFGEGDDD
jgi:RNA polymerase-associated protein CTR9